MMHNRAQETVSAQVILNVHGGGHQEALAWIMELFASSTDVELLSLKDKWKALREL
jgi:hypothetical protein